MDNIILEKIWQEEDLIELKITVNSEYASAYQNCYIQDKNLKTISNSIVEYSCNSKKTCYVEFGKKEGNYTPAFSMYFLPSDEYGHIKIEVDIEIADNNVLAHRCSFYVNSELGLIEKFGMCIIDLITEKEGVKVSLVPTS